MQIDTEAVKHQLFANSEVRARIVRDYGLVLRPATADELVSAVLHQLDQVPAPHPLEQAWSNRDVFRAAVKALGSNCRPWAAFLKHERRLGDLLSGYDPVRACDAIEEGRLRLDQIKGCLPGPSSSADSRAICRWARLLTEVEEYYAFVKDLGAAFC
jgi:hypothetical protein